MMTRATPFWLKLLTPNIQLESAFEITPDWLLEHGLKGLALDIDNTLAPTHLAGDETQIRAWLEPLKQANIPIRIVSNGHPQRILEFCELFKLEYIDILNLKMAAKPIPKAYSRASSQMNLQPNQVAMVGDQIFTDVLGANLAGMYSVLVKPLSEKAMTHTKWIRKLEKLVLAKLERERI